MTNQTTKEELLLKAMMRYFDYFGELAPFPIYSRLTDEEMIEALYKAVETDTKIVDTTEYLEGRYY